MSEHGTHGVTDDAGFASTSQDLSSTHIEIDAALSLRSVAGSRFFRSNCSRLATLCEQMAIRFARGGRLIGIGASPAARSDVHHVTVEFVHPVIVGKRALPAFGITGTASSIATQVRLLAEPADIVLALDSDCEEFAHPAMEALALAKANQCLTIAFRCDQAEYNLVADCDDAFVRQEICEVAYHMLWELVHVFFDHNVSVSEGKPPAVRTQSAASFLYPFLDRPTSNLDSVIADVERSILAKSDEINSLRLGTVGDHDSGNRRAFLGATQAITTSLERGGTIYAMGNGGSATDAMDTVADYLFPPAPLKPRRAQDLAQDAAIITALTNDIGPDVIFSRQLIAHARQKDIVVAYSTSGNSRNVILALSEARSRGLSSIAFVGYDGGRILSDGLADHVISTDSQNIPRIQEAQATAHHIMRSLVG